jgi:hypothetical protein
LISRPSVFAATNRSVPSISILISLPARRTRIGTDRIWVSSSVTLCNGIAGTSRSDAEPRRTETYVDLVEAHVDPIDQGSEDSTPARCGQLGPELG